MRLALYHPVGGYYTSAAPFGADGDYYTSPAAHPAFGALLCVQLRHMWRLIGKPPQFTVVEMGAGNGILANDVAAYAPRLSPEFARCLRYICIDRYAPASAAANPSVDRLRAQGVPLRAVHRLPAIQRTCGRLPRPPLPHRERRAPRDLCCAGRQRRFHRDA